MTPMNRWWGSSAESSKQTSERDQRAANGNQRAVHQTLSQLNLNPLSSDEEYKDCDTSIHNTFIH